MFPHIIIQCIYLVSYYIVYALSLLPPEMAGGFKQRGCYTPLFGGAGPPYFLPGDRATTRGGGAKG